jgi:hypothetical protein
MTSAISEQGNDWFCQRTEKLRREVAVLETKLAEFEQTNSRTPVLLRMLGNYFQVGAAGNLEGVQFKLKIKHEELDHFETWYGMLGSHS